MSYRKKEKRIRKIVNIRKVIVDENITCSNKSDPQVLNHTHPYTRILCKTSCSIVMNLAYQNLTHVLVAL